MLLKNDCYIPGHPNTDETDLARRAAVTASSETPGGEAANVINGYAREVINRLPMEFAVEAQKLLSISLEGSVG